jgi:hypothetical protein
VFRFGQHFDARLNWTRFSRRTKRHLLLVSAVTVVTYTAMLASHWRFSSPVVNEILGSLAVGSYSLLVVLMTLLRPKLLFYGLVTLLILVVPMALVVLPLSAYTQGSIKTEHIAGNLYFDKLPWDAGAMGSSGTTLLIYERPASVPFMVHDLQRVVFDDGKCISNKALVLLQTDGRHVLARCPWPEYEHKQGFHDFLVPLF